MTKTMALDKSVCKDRHDDCSASEKEEANFKCLKIYEGYFYLLNVK